MLSYRKAAPEPGLELTDIAEPGDPGPNEVLVSVEAVGICGSDLHVLEWDGGYEFMIPHLPVTLGHEFAGVVARTGEEVSHVVPGDRVTVWPSSPCGACPACRDGISQNCRDKRTLGLYSDGAFAPEVLCRANGVFPLPEYLDFEIGALTEPLCVGHRSVAVGDVGQGASVLVLGPGTIGQAIAIFARDAGAAEVAIAGYGDTARLAVCADLGFTTTFDLAREDDRVAMERDWSGTDVIFEATGRAVSVTDGLALLQTEGVLVMTGIHSRDITFAPTDFVRRKLQIRASHGSRQSDWEAVIGKLCADGPSLRPMITHRLALPDIAEGFELARQRLASKVMVFPQDTGPKKKVER